MGWPLIITLLVLGILLIVLEIVALPGAIAGICGFLLTATSIWQTYATQGTHAGHIVVLCTLAAFIILLVYFMKAKTWRRFSLNDQIDSKVRPTTERIVAIGDTGKTLSRLAPVGNALLNEKILEVHSEQEFIEEDTPIVVTAVEGNRVTVRENRQESTDSQTNLTPQNGIQA